jgi:hypothetical protein
MLEIEDLQKAMREAPEYCAKEVNKVDAVRLLVPQIQEMQTRGYSLGKIAEFLSAKGFIIKPAALKNYLTRIKAETAKKTPRIPVRSRTSDQTVSGTSARRRETSMGSERSGGSGAGAEIDRERSGESRDGSAGPSAVVSSPAARTSPVGAASRAGSTPRKDAPDL